MEPSDRDFYQRLNDAIESAEVMSIFFVRVGRSMILDCRPDEEGAKAVLVDEMVATPQERLNSFRRLRPGLPAPDRLTLAPWTSAVREFEAMGAFDSLLARCEIEGGSLLRNQARTAYQGLLKLERRYLRDLVRGVGMQTIWQRTEP